MSASSRAGEGLRCPWRPAQILDAIPEPFHTERGPVCTRDARPQRQPVFGIPIGSQRNPTLARVPSAPCLSLIRAPNAKGCPLCRTIEGANPEHIRSCCAGWLAAGAGVEGVTLGRRQRSTPEALHSRRLRAGLFWLNRLGYSACREPMNVARRRRTSSDAQRSCMDVVSMLRTHRSWFAIMNVSPRPRYNGIYPMAASPKYTPSNASSRGAGRTLLQFLFLNVDGLRNQEMDLFTHTRMVCTLAIKQCRIERHGRSETQGWMASRTTGAQEPHYSMNPTTMNLGDGRRSIRFVMTSG